MRFIEKNKDGTETIIEEEDGIVWWITLVQSIISDIKNMRKNK